MLCPHNLLDRYFSRPKRRSECKKGPRPCPWVGCPYHLYLDINPVTGSIKFNFKEKIIVINEETGGIYYENRILDVCELKETCALDVSHKGAHTLQEVGEYMNVTRERVRQIEEVAMRKIRAATTSEMEEYLDLDS